VAPAGRDHPFNSEDAIVLAAMCFQANQLFEVGKLTLPKGFELRHTVCALAGVEAPTAEVFGFLAESSDAIVVAFRGTETFKDNESDQDLFQVIYPFVRNAGKTQRGFTCVYQSMRDELIRMLIHLPTTKRLMLTGYSLGGALAPLAALDIAVNTGFDDPIMYSYGGPRFADPTFARRYDCTVRNSARVFNVHDVIPTLPDRAYLPPFTDEGLYYKHVKASHPVSFQLNSLARNHYINCYFKSVSENDPDFARRFCRGNPGFCPDAEICVPFIGTCSENRADGVDEGD